MEAILPYYFEYHFNIAGVEAKDPAFEHKGIALICPVPYFSQTVNTLVCVYPDYCGSSNVPDDCNPHVGYLQVRRI